MIGDRRHDILGAKKCGLDGIGVRFGYAEEGELEKAGAVKMCIRDRQKDFLVFAMPVLINELLWGTGTSMLTAVIGHLGSSMVAAHSVAQVVRLSLIHIF